MKKIIATIIRFVMPKAIKQHEKEEKARRIHNAVIIQSLLDNEHMIKDAVNERFDTVYTTKKALKTARVYGISDYRSDIALDNADFK